MGLCTSCFRATSQDVPTPDIETRRRQLMAAAEQRRQENEMRGIKDIDKVRRMQERTAEIEKRERETTSSGGPVLKWQAD